MCVTQPSTNGNLTTLGSTSSLFGVEDMLGHTSYIRTPNFIVHKVSLLLYINAHHLHIPQLQ